MNILQGGWVFVCSFARASTPDFIGGKQERSAGAGALRSDKVCSRAVSTALDAPGARTQANRASTGDAKRMEEEEEDASHSFRSSGF